MYSGFLSSRGLLITGVLLLLHLASFVVPLFSEIFVVDTFYIIEVI